MTSRSPEVSGHDHPSSYASAAAGSTSPPDRNRFFSKRGLDFSTDESMPAFRSGALPPPTTSINTSFSNSQRLHEPPPTPTSSLEFLKRSVENAKSAKASVPIITTTATNGILTAEASRPFPMLRRARADTMPSQSSAFPYTASHSSSMLSLTSLSSSNNSSSNLLSPPTNSITRHRSGSLTLPSASISGAFGPSIFSTSWMDQGREDNNPPQTQPPPTPTTDQLLRDDSSNTIVRTLVSLGLDDDRDAPPTPVSAPSSNSDMRLPIDLPPRPLMSANRFRSYSVSAAQNYPDTPPDSSPSTPTSTTDPSSSSRLLPPVGSSLHHYFHQTSNRPRAISLGMLDYSNNDAFIPPALRALSQSTLGGASSSLREEIRDDEMDQEDASAIALGNALRNSLNSGDLLGMMVNGYNDGSGKRADRVPPGLAAHSRSQSMQSIAEMEVAQGYGTVGDYSEDLSPYTSPTQDHSRLSSSTAPSNLHVNNSNTGGTSPSSQTPTRSLWIGNVDPTLTNNELMQLFSPFGQIESLRLLPDKECAFVNFTRVDDAVRAREEIMGRMGGRVGNCVVRVGFGKAEVGVPDAAVMQPTRAL
ncbi:hypothetical protein BC938DRAFT_476151, partial [Jimgerdemannia flammicorona]